MNLDVASPQWRRARIKAARDGFVKRGVLRCGFLDSVLRSGDAGDAESQICASHKRKFQTDVYSVTEV